MAYQQQSNPNQRPKNALDVSKLSLSAPSSAEGKWAFLSFALVKNNPRIEIRTNDPADKAAFPTSYGKLTANMDSPGMYALIELIKYIAELPAGTPIDQTRAAIECRGYTFYGGKRSETPSIISEVWVGKDEEQGVWISVAVKDRPRIKFYMQFSQWLGLKGGDGKPFGKLQASALFAKGYANMLSNLYANVMSTEFVEEDYGDKGGQGNNNGGGQRNNNYSNNQSGGSNGSYRSNNNSGNQGGGSNQSTTSSTSEEFSDDIPF